jgi:hypothetical protein
MGLGIGLIVAMKKVKLSLCVIHQAVKYYAKTMYEGVEVYSTIFNPGTRLKSVVIFTPLPLSPG